MLLVLIPLITIFLYRSIEYASKAKRSLLYTKKKENKTILEILDILQL